MSQRWRDAPRAGSRRSSWRRSRSRAATTSPASSRASRATTGTSSTTWWRRSCSVSPSVSGASCSQTSILARLTGPLCDAVTGQDGGKAMLEALDRGEPVPRPARRPSAVVSLPPPLRRRAAGAPAGRAARPTSRPASAGERVVRAERRAVRGHPPRVARRGLAARGEPDRARRAGDAPDEAGGHRPRLAHGTPERGRPSAGPCSASTTPGTLLLHGELEGVEARLRDAERWLDTGAGAIRTGDRPQMVVVDEVEFRALPCRIAIYRAAAAPDRGRRRRHHAIRPTGAGAGARGRPLAPGAAPLVCWRSPIGGMATWSPPITGMPCAWPACSRPATSPTRSGSRSRSRTSGPPRVASARRCAPTSRGCSEPHAQSGPVLRGTADMHVGMSDAPA